MKRSKFALFGCIAVLAAGLLISVSAKSQYETCTAAVGGDGHCIPLWDSNGNLVGYHCASGTGFPSCYY
jgi:hypothetical protein